jgi:hypothetical protein
MKFFQKPMQYVPQHNDECNKKKLTTFKFEVYYTYTLINLERLAKCIVDAEMMMNVVCINEVIFGSATIWVNEAILFIFLFLYFF